MKFHFKTLRTAAIYVVAIGVAVGSVNDIPLSLRPFFAPPAEYAGRLGNYASPLKFNDGHLVGSRSEWPARRSEILKYWQSQMGPWPELLAMPRLETVETQQRGDVAQLRVNIEVERGIMQQGFLLLPPSRFGGRRPAVLVTYYTPEVSIAYDGPRLLEGESKKTMESNHGRDRDFALQLANRGFVTLAIGQPGNGGLPPRSAARCQPLSYLAYIAANCHTALAQRQEVDGTRIGVMGHSFGGKWAMFASCLYDKFAAAVWSDLGIVFDETKPNVNYWEPWYLGHDATITRAPGVITPQRPRTGAYKAIFETGHDLHELHALMAPRPFLVSGGSEDRAERWLALNHAIAVNRFLGYENHVALTTRTKHAPTPESNEQAFLFLEHFLKP